MGVHPIDTSLYSWKFSADEVREIWEEESLVETWLTVEATFAASQAELGMIPEQAARDIEAHATTDEIRLDDVAVGFRQTNLDSVALVKALADAVPESARGYVHYGFTTTDLTETALALQLSEMFDLLRRDLRSLRAALISLADEHADTLMVARTHSQHALPYSFGLKAAIWAKQVAHLLDRLDALEPTVCVSKAVGAVGTYASFGDEGIELEAEVCRRLDLERCDITAQNSSERFKRYLTLLGAIASTVGTIAAEIWTRQRTEIDELREPRFSNSMSSTFAFKRNPLQCEWIRGTATLVKHQANAMKDLDMRDERDGTRFAFYRLLIPEASILTHTVVTQLRPVIENLEVDVESMERNLGLSDGFINSEHVMMEIARRGAGKQTAYEILGNVATLAREEGLSFSEALLREGSALEFISEADLERLTDPAEYLGKTVALVERTVDELREPEV